MVKAIQVHEVGGPEAMVYGDIELPPPGPGEVRVRNRAIGVNFIDVYHRTGLYPPPVNAVHSRQRRRRRRRCARRGRDGVPEGRPRRLCRPAMAATPRSATCRRECW